MNLSLNKKKLYKYNYTRVNYFHLIYHKLFIVNIDSNINLFSKCDFKKVSTKFSSCLVCTLYMKYLF